MTSNESIGWHVVLRQPLRTLMWNGMTRHLRAVCFWIVTALVAGPLGSLHARGQEERPEVHADYRVGVFPWSESAVARFESEDVRLLMSGLHRGWSVDKVIDETERPRVRILTAMDELESADLVRGRNDYNMRPGFPVFREADLVVVEPSLERDAGELVRIIEERWGEVETFAASLQGGQEFPQSEAMYRIVIGGVLEGGMIDALFDDQTLTPPPPRRGRRGTAYYAWMVEGEANPTPIVIQSARVGRHEVFSVGPVPETTLRVQIDELAGVGPVYGSEDARRWRVFSSVFSRDYLFPYLKAQRGTLLDLHAEVESAGYTAFGEFVAWYYQALVGRVADSLAGRGRIDAPETSLKYALREARR